MVGVDEKKRNQMATQYDDGGVTVAFHGREVYEGVPISHFSKKSPLNDKQNKAAENKYNSNKVTTDGTLSRGEAISSAVIQAEGLKSNLKPEFPSFVKSLVRSHVASCFWMGLPVAFCKRHLPDKDTTITLEDESGREYKTKYIACKTGLSAGWRQFSAVHKLLEGDVVVFQLVEPTKFKVYIIRAGNSKEVDGAFMNLDSCTKQKVGGKNIIDTDVACNSPKRKNGKHVPQDMQKKKKIVAPKMETKTKQFTEQFENDSDEAFSEIFEGFKMPEFKDVKGFQNFSIIVDGMPIDDELSTEVRNKYYKLCYSQQAFLHENLIRGLNYMLIVGIISEIVNIADAIKVSVISTPRFEFSNWDKALHAFEKLGMNVEFLRVRLRRLVSIAYEMDNAPETRRYLAYRTEDHSRAENEIKNMEIKLEELKEACSGFGDYLESLKHKAERYEHKFQQEVAASW
ncbi:B3 domain-containing protein Os01g0234100-like [Trifolium pratense]|uniref:B3 domain-containing protein Os01g0234100-like n=1 Tax=Trifolium pratense TaxID=57577 RepID=UPI001E695920|nr:B3 domain-containing protein Os01g0234100-like [Trifolium pratense]